MTKYTPNKYKRNWLERLLLRLGLIRVDYPWERKDIPAWQRAMWIQSEPKSLGKVR